MKKRPDLTEQTKQNITDAFWRLYKEKPIHKITIKEITTVAGYNRSTFYEYFSDVYDVLEQLEMSLLPNMDQLPPLEMDEIENQLDGIIHLYESQKDYYSVLLGDHGDPAFMGKMKAVLKPMVLKNMGPIPKDKLTMLDYALEYNLSAMIGVLNYWYRQEDPIPVEELVAILIRISDSNLPEQLAED